MNHQIWCCWVRMGVGGEWGEGRKHHQVAPWMRWIRVSSHLLKLCGPWFCPRTSWGGGGGGGRAKLGMGRCERWGEGGCWGRGEQWLNSDRAFLFSEGGWGGCWAMGSFPVAYWCHFFVFTQNAIGWDARSSENSQTASLFFLSCQGPVLRFADTHGVTIRLLAGNPSCNPVAIFKDNFLHLKIWEDDRNRRHRPSFWMGAHSPWSEGWWHQHWHWNWRLCWIPSLCWPTPAGRTSCHPGTEKCWCVWLRMLWGFLWGRGGGRHSTHHQLFDQSLPFADHLSELCDHMEVLRSAFSVS